MMSSISALGLVAVLACSRKSADQKSALPLTFWRVYPDALRLVRDGKFAEALAKLDTAAGLAETDKDRYYLHNKRAECYAGLGCLDEALEEYEIAVRYAYTLKSTEYVQLKHTFNGWIEVLRSRDDFDKVEAAYRQWIELSSAEDAKWEYVGFLLLEARNARDAGRMTTGQELAGKAVAVFQEYFINTCGIDGGFCSNKTPQQQQSYIIQFQGEKQKVCQEFAIECPQ
jgi:tetratricopeptide (TPR) repeat protein